MESLKNAETQLYIIPTPVGNLDDMTYRGVKLLQSVDLILAEDTRQTKKLCAHYGIQTPLAAHHKFNEHQTAATFVRRMQQGEVMALVSDGGTPGISDPGFLLLRTAIEQNIKTETLPGATAVIPAVVNSGFPCHKFVFEGFLPHKKGRQTRLKLLAEETRTIVLYESPHRIIKCLQQIHEFFTPETQVCVCREISKLHEEFLRGTPTEIINHFETHKPKGEIVVVIEGKK